MLISIFTILVDSVESPPGALKLNPFSSADTQMNPACALLISEVYCLNIDIPAFTLVCCGAVVLIDDTVLKIDDDVLNLFNVINGLLMSISPYVAFDCPDEKITDPFNFIVFPFIVISSLLAWSTSQLPIFILFFEVFLSPSIDPINMFLSSSTEPI